MKFMLYWYFAQSKGRPMSNANTPNEFWGIIPKGTDILSMTSQRSYSMKVETTSRTIRAKFNTGMHVFNSALDAVKEYLADGGDYELNGTFGDRLAMWGKHDDYKYVDVNKIQKVDPPKKAERKETGPTMAQLLQPGSKWKTTFAVPLESFIIEKRTAPKNGYTWSVKVYKPDGELPTGTEFEVLNKPETASHYHEEGREGMYVQVSVNGTPYELKVTHLKGSEQLNAAEAQPVFVIRDSITGEYYQASEYKPDDNGVWRHHAPTMSTKFSHAKKWKRLSDVRSSMLESTGYFHDLPGANNLPEWMGHSGVIKHTDVPRTWEIVKINKLDKQVMETIELVDTLDRSWRLRDLTVKYGGGVRAAYSELEKKNRLDEYPVMIVFSVPENQKTHWWNEGMTDEQRAEINQALSIFKKTDIIRGKGGSDYAIACKDVNEALMIKLAGSSTMECHLLDLQNLTEIVS
jgi:hypothetical protein